MRDPGKRLRLGAALVVGGGLLLLGSATGCDTVPVLRCPPADPPMTAQYSGQVPDGNGRMLDEITVKVGSNANTGEMTFTNPTSDDPITGGNLTFSDAGKSLLMRITVNPTAKEVTAFVKPTCTDGLDGSYTLVVKIPGAHQTGDYLPVTVRDY